MIATGAAACLASCHGDETQQREDIQAEGSGNQNKFSRRSAGETKATRRGSSSPSHGRVPCVNIAQNRREKQRGVTKGACAPFAPPLAGFVVPRYLIKQSRWAVIGLHLN